MKKWALLFALMLILSGCVAGPSGITQEQFDAVVIERDALKSALNALKREIAELETAANQGAALPEFEGIILLDNDDITLTFIGVKENTGMFSGYYGDEVRFEVVNKTDKPMWIRFNAFALDGIEVYGSADSTNISGNARGTTFLYMKKESADMTFSYEKISGSYTYFVNEVLSANGNSHDFVDVLIKQGITIRP